MLGKKVKRAFRSALNRAGYDYVAFVEPSPRPIRRTLLHTLIELAHARDESFFFVQVGANDGVHSDPIHEVVRRLSLRGLLLEPNPTAFAQLQRTYAGHEGLVLVCAALDERCGTRTLWQLKAEFNPHGDGLNTRVGSFHLEAMEEYVRRARRDRGRPIRDMVDPVEVETITFEALFERHAVEAVDLLQIDAEGHDFEILELFDLERYRPGIVHFESRELSRAQRDRVASRLLALGYELDYGRRDTLACLPPRASRERVAKLR